MTCHAMPCPLHDEHRLEKVDLESWNTSYASGGIHIYTSGRCLRFMLPCGRISQARPSLGHSISIVLRFASTRRIFLSNSFVLYLIIYRHDSNQTRTATRLRQEQYCGANQQSQLQPGFPMTFQAASSAAGFQRVHSFMYEIRFLMTFKN